MNITREYSVELEGVVWRENLKGLDFPNYELHRLEDGTFKVYSLKKNIYLKESISTYNYCVVGMINSKGKQRSRLMHRIIALMLIENDDPKRKRVVNHKDGNKQNNKLYNLEWTTIKANNQHARDIGLMPKGGPSKIKEKDVFIILKMRKEKKTKKQIAEHFGVEPGVIGRVLEGKTHSYIKREKLEHTDPALREKDVYEIKELLETTKMSLKEIGDRYGVGHYTISRILHNKRWSHLNLNIKRYSRLKEEL